MAVSMHDLATHGRRNRLGCARPRRLARAALLEVDLAAAHVSFATDVTFRAHVGSERDTATSRGSSSLGLSCWQSMLFAAEVDVTDVLRVAQGHFRDSAIDIEVSAVSLLTASPALFANGKRDLVARAAFIGRTAEDVAGHE